MPISVQCVCAKKFSAPDKLAGKRVKCPSCGQPLDIPDPAADPLFPELSEGDLVAADDPLAQAPAPKPAPKPRKTDSQEVALLKACATGGLTIEVADQYMARLAALKAPAS